MHALLWIIIEPDPPPGLAVDERDLFAAAQIRHGLRPPTRGNPIGNAAAVSSAVETEYQSRFCPGFALHKRIDAKLPMRPNQTGFSPFEKIEPWPPHQRPVGK